MSLSGRSRQSSNTTLASDGGSLYPATDQSSILARKSRRYRASQVPALEKIDSTDLDDLDEAANKPRELPHGASVDEEFQEMSLHEEEPEPLPVLPEDDVLPHVKDPIRLLLKYEVISAMAC